jgi:hypothetical protein
VVLCVNRIWPEQKKQFPEVLCIFQIRPELKPDSLLSEKFPSLANPNIAGATLSGTPSSKEQKNSAGGASFCCTVRRSHLSSPPAVSYHQAGANCSAGNPPPRGNSGLKRTRTDAILKKLIEK